MLPRTDSGGGRPGPGRRSRFLFALRLSRDKRSKRRQTSRRSAASLRPLPRAIRVRGELSPFRSLRLVARVPSPRARSTCTLITHYLNGDVRGIHEDASLLSRDPSWRVCAPANTVTKHYSPIVSSTSLRAGIDGDRLLSIITVAWTIENFPWVFNFGFSMIIKKK